MTLRSRQLLTAMVILNFGVYLQAETIFDERTWTSADESSTFVGTLTAIQSGKVTIEKDGSPLTFSVGKLSKADRDFLGQGITLTTLDGKTYENASVSKIAASSITLMMSSGIVTVGMEQLPEEMRTRFGYDPAAAAKEQEAMAKADAARQAQLVAMQEAQAKEAARKADLEKAEYRDCYVYQFVDDGLIFHTHGYTDGEGTRTRMVLERGGWGSLNQILDARLRDNQYHLKGLPDTPVLVDDHIFSAYVIPDGVYEHGGSRLKSFRFVKWGGVLDMDKSMGSRQLIYLPLAE